MIYLYFNFTKLTNIIKKKKKTQTRQRDKNWCGVEEINKPSIGSIISGCFSVAKKSKTEVSSINKPTGSERNLCSNWTHRNSRIKHRVLVLTICFRLVYHSIKSYLFFIHFNTEDFQSIIERVLCRNHFFIPSIFFCLCRVYWKSSFCFNFQYFFIHSLNVNKNIL